MAILYRWILAFCLLAATYNPTPYNYWQWTTDYGAQNLSLAILLGLLLLVSYIIYLRAPLRSIGGFGMTLILAIVCAGIWVLIDLNVLTLLYLDFAKLSPSASLAEVADGAVFGV